jgi:GGDEF domain-containing protein
LFFSSTGVFSRRLREQFSRALRHDRHLSVMMLDADNFKLINDHHRHSAGDEVLRAIAERCRSVVRMAERRDKSALSFRLSVEHCGSTVEHVRHNLSVVWDA